MSIFEEWEYIGQLTYNDMCDILKQKTDGFTVDEVREILPKFQGFFHAWGMASYVYGIKKDQKLIEIPENKDENGYRFTFGRDSVIKEALILLNNFDHFGKYG